MFLIDFTAPTCSKTHEKLNKKQVLKTQWKQMMISSEKHLNLEERLPNGVRKGEAILGKFTLAPLVAPLVPQSVFLLKRYSQSAPKVVPSLQKWLQQGSQSSQCWSQALLLILRVVGYPALICNCVHLQLCSFAIGQRTHLRTHRAHSLLWLRTYQKDAILDKRHIFTVILHKHDFAFIGRMPDPL